MLHMSLWGTDGADWELDAAEMKLRGNQSVCRDLSAILDYRLSHARVRPHDFTPLISGPLGLHATYTRSVATPKRLQPPHAPASACKFHGGTLNLD
jgi:hypothetical protein